MGRPVDQIDRAAVLSVLGPVYRDKPATGKLLRGWVRGVLAAAQALGHVDVNAAGEVIDAALPKTPKTRTHRRALRTPGAVVGGGCGGAGGHEGAFRRRGDSLVFPGVGGRRLNGGTLVIALRRATGTDADVHGFRSSFRTWAAERSGATRDVAELALAHVVGGAVERSYARSDLFDQRRGLMDRWAAFVTRPVPTR